MRLRNKYYFKSIKTKVHILIILIISLTVIITSYTIFRFEKNYFINEFISNSIGNCNNFAGSVKYEVMVEDISELNEKAKSFMLDENVLAMYIYDSELNLIFEQSRLNFNKDNFTTLRNSFIESGEIYRTLHWQLEPHLLCQSHISFLDKKFDPTLQKEIKNLGNVVVLYHMHSLAKSTGIFAEEIFKISFFMVFLFFFISVWLFKGITNSFENLIFTSRKIGQGNFKARSTVQSHDEMGELAFEINLMAMNLEEKQELEKKLIIIDKNSTMSVLAGGLAHEFNNILTLIQTEAQASQELKEIHYYDASMTNILCALKTGQSITNNLLNYSKPNEIAMKEINISQLIQDTLKLIRTEFLQFNIKINFVMSGECFIWGDFSSIQQLLINLLINARDAMRNGGKLNVKLWTNEQCIQLTIADNGLGISKKDLPFIFKPFFTTKRNDNQNAIVGTGLGLTIVKKIVDQHYGFISIESEPGIGTTVIVNFPKSLVMPAPITLANKHT